MSGAEGKMNPAALLSRISDRRAGVVVLGQGYVGLTLACAAAEAGFRTVGMDIDAGRIAALTLGTMVVPGVDPLQFRAGIDSGT